MEAKNSKFFHVPITVSNPIPTFEPSEGDCKRTRISHVTIMDLPTVIMVKILSRLSIKPIFRCKTVCKLWYHLLTSDPLFLNMYHPNFPCLLLSYGCSNPSLLELKADYDYYSRPIELSPNFHLPPLLQSEAIIPICSCNGFICLLNGKPYGENQSLYITNPLLGEYFKLKLPKWDNRVCGVAYGFCFSEASGQYKVLRLVVFKGRNELSELEIFTLGVDEKWRNVGQVPFPVWDDSWPRFDKAYVNGALHWMDHDKNDSIYSFDFGTEKLKFLPAPPGLKTPSYCLRLSELGKCLCLTDHIYKQRLDIWWMKEYGIAESWTKKESILVDFLPPDMGMFNYEVILIWKDGEILMRIGSDLASYNPKEKKFKEVNVNGSGTAPTTYIPSFYSLQTVMGNNFQVSHVYPKRRIT